MSANESAIVNAADIPLPHPTNQQQQQQPLVNVAHVNNNQNTHPTDSLEPSPEQQQQQQPSPNTLDKPTDDTTNEQQQQPPQPSVLEQHANYTNTNSNTNTKRRSRIITNCKKRNLKCDLNSNNNNNSNSNNINNTSTNTINTINTINTTTNNNAGCETEAKKGGRGSSFSPEEALYMSKAWVEEAIQAPIGEFTKWGAIQKICSDTYGMNRSSESLRCAWSRISKECQLFLEIRSKIIFDQSHTNNLTENDIDVMCLEAYRRKTGKHSNSAFHVGSPFKYLNAAKYLSKQPKFLEDRLEKHNNNISNNNNNNNSNSNDIMMDDINHIRSSTLIHSPSTTNNNMANNHNNSTNTVNSILIGGEVSEKDMKNNHNHNTNDDETNHTNTNVEQTTLNVVDGATSDGGVTSEHSTEMKKSNKRFKLDDIPEFRRCGKSKSTSTAMEVANDNSYVGGSGSGSGSGSTPAVSEHGEDFRLLQMLPTGSPEYTEIIEDMMKERRLRARERLARKELIVLDLEKEVRRKRLDF